MKILVLVMYYWPDETGIAGFLTRRCEYLASRGHEVTVCTGFPFYPQWRIAPEYRGRLFQRETHNGVKIVRSYLFVPRRVTSARRIIHEASFVASSIPAALTQHKPDLIFVVSPPLGLAMAGVFLSRVWRIPYIFHVEDLQPDAASDLNMLSSPFLLKPLFALERMAYRNAAMVSTLTDGMRQRILAKGVAPDKVPVFRHWSDPALFKVRPVEDGQAFRRSKGLDGNFLVTHCGNMGVKQGLEVILEAA
jgi:colanic acid biosynthesis glycosyl transferase WcaI